MKPKRHSLKSAIGSTLCGVVVMNLAGLHSADADTTWTVATSQTWTDSSNWNNGLPSTSNGVITITTAVGNFPVLSSSASAGWDVLIGTGTSGRLDHTAGTLATGNGNWMFLGWQGAQATYNLADTSASGGTYTGFGQGGGSLDVGGAAQNGNLFVGLDNGTVSRMNIHTTGSVNAGGIFVASNGGSSDGTVNLDSGTVNVSGETQIGASFWGNGGNGKLNVSGGTFNANILSFARGSNNSAAITGTGIISGGTINAKQWLTLGFAGSASNIATVTNGGGTLNVNTAGGGNIELGVWDSTRNTFNQNSGALNVQNNASILFGVLGHNGQSTFNHNGGSVTFFSDGGTTPGGSGSLVIGSRGANGWEVSSGTYAYNLNGGTLTVPKIQKISTASATFNFNGGTLKPTAASTTFLQGLSAAYVQAGGAVVDTSGLDITIGQSLLADPVSTGGGLVKNGAGTLTLGGANSFTGTAIINQGTLQFSGQSSTVGNITAADSAKLAVRAIDAFTTVASCGTLTLGDTTGATLAFDFNSVNSSGSATALVVASDVTVNGALTTQYSNSVALTSGVVPLIQYTGTFTGTVPTGSITLGSRASGALSLDPDNKILNLVVSADSPKWTGLDSSEWTTGSTGSNQNWQLIAGGTTTSYLAGDTVLFDESAGSDHAAITITSADVSPGLTTFDHSAFDFTVTGGFGISGSGSLVKSGSGKLTLATPNSYSGSTSIQNGTLQLGDGSADGSLDGTSGVLDNGTLAYVLSGDQTAGYPITGFGKVTKSGSGTLTLGGTNTFSDGLDVSGGVVSVGSQANLGAVANIVTLDGGTLRTTQNAWWGDMTRTLRIGSGGGVLNIAGQATGGEGSRLVLWSGAPTGSLTGSGNLTVTGDGALDDFSGTGTLVIVGAYTGFTGNLILDQGGTVEFDNATPISATSTVILQDDSQVTVANGQNVANPITVSGTNSVIAFNNSPGTFSGAISLSNDVNIGLRNWWDFGIAQSGTLSGVISGSHGVLVNRGTSTGTPTLTLSGANTYTGNTTVAAGTTVQLAAAGGLKFVIGAAGDSNKITGSGAATLDGSFTFDLSGAATGTHSWTIVDTATKSFGPTFSVNGFTQASDIWKMTADGFTWSFSEASGVLSVAPAASGFDSWITGFGLTSQMEATDDPDGDGFNNLMEYALGGNPNSNSAAITPTGTKSGADFILTFSRSDASVSGGDLTLNLEYGDDLTGWTTVAVPAADNTVGGVSFDVTDGSPNDTVTATIPNAGGPTFFARIKAVK